ncbi:MAG: alpha/beta fold hydrolase, partial [Anaerolineaceae bacterium]|nr:alpha/beta fold hydrolase [Anaerolineaceae bacterium]
MSSIQGLFVKETGQPEGIPIVFIHGGGGALWTWDEVVPLLPEYRCILPDLPEHGQTGMAAGPFSIGAAAKLMADLIRQRTPQGKAHVVGLSVGAQIGVEMLAKTPEVMESAVISSAQLLPVAGERLGLYSERVMAAVYWLWIAPFKHSDGWIRANMKFSAGIPGRYFAVFRQNFRGITRDGWAHVMAENFRYRTPAGLGKAYLPVLLVAGTKETGSIHASHQRLAGELPNVQAVLIGNHTDWSVAQEHNWPLNDPALFAAMVRAWVTGTALPDILQPM